MPASLQNLDMNLTPNKENQDEERKEKWKSFFELLSMVYLTTNNLSRQKCKKKRNCSSSL